MQKVKGTQFQIPTQSLRDRLQLGVRFVFDENAQDDERTIQGEWLVAAARAGVPIDVSNAIIAGDADFTAMQFQKICRVVGSRFLNFTTFERAAFTDLADFESSVFNMGVSFDSTRFRADFSLQNVSIEGHPLSEKVGLRLSDAQFGGVLAADHLRIGKDLECVAYRASFSSAAYLRHCRFGGRVSLSRVQSAGSLDFFESRFLQDVEAGDMNIANYFRLSGARFALTAPVYFNDLGVGGAVSLEGTRFGATVNFTAAHLGSLRASRCCFMREASFTDVVVAGNSSFAEARFSKRAPAGFEGAASSGFDASRARFVAAAKFRNARFGNFVFRDGRAQSAVDLSGVHLTGELVVAGATFEMGLNASSLVVGTDASFDGSYFRGDLVGSALRAERMSFKRVRCEGEVDCYEMAVRQSLLISNSRFEKSVSCHSTVVGGDLSLYGSTFKGDAIFSSSEIKNVFIDDPDPDGDLPAASFHGKLSFAYSKLGRLQCAGMRCSDSACSADFSNITVGARTDFQMARVRKLDLSGATLGECRLSEASLDGEVGLTDARINGTLAAHSPSTWKRGSFSMEGLKYDRIELKKGEMICRTDDWKDWVALPKRYTPSTYTTLEAALRKHGAERFADEVYLGLRRSERGNLRNERDFPRYVGSWLLEVGVGYGVKGWRLFVWTVVGLALAWIGTSMATYGVWLSSKTFLYTLDTFLPVDLGQELPMTVATPPAVLVFAITLLGWILVPLALAYVSGVLKRQG